MAIDLNVFDDQPIPSVTAPKEQPVGARDAMVLKMALEGKTYEQIGDAIGKGRQAAYQLVAKLRKQGVSIPNPRSIRQEARRRAAEERAAAKAARKGTHP